MRSSAAILGRCSSPVYFRFGPDTAEQRAKISVRFAAKQSRRSAFGHFPPLVCFAPIPAVRTGSRGRRERTLAGPPDPTARRAALRLARSHGRLGGLELRVRSAGLGACDATEPWRRRKAIIGEPPLPREPCVGAFAVRSSVLENRP